MTKDERKAIVSKFAEELSAVLLAAADEDQIQERLRLALRVVIGAWTIRLVGCNAETVHEELAAIRTTISEILDGEYIKLIMVTRV